MSRAYLNDLAAFVAVAEARSFTRAAKRLGISQSALSHTMRGLEERLGVRLLARTTRSVSPTEAGERLLQTVGPRFTEIDAEITALADLRNKPSGIIRITTSEHAARSILWPVAESLMQQNPEITFEINIDGRFVDIVAERFDAGIRLGESIEKDMVAVRISPDLRMAAVASPAYLAVQGIPMSPQDLSAHKCINLRFQTRGDLYAWEFEKEGRAINVRVEGPLILNNTSLILNAAVNGHGIAFMLEDYVADQLATRELVRVLADWCEPFGGYYLYYPSRRQHLAAFTLLVEALRSHYASTMVSVPSSHTQGRLG
jgi:DNA-binding transcriptional LysR family regulator